MARIRGRNFGLPKRLRAELGHRPILRLVDEAIVTLLFSLLLIGAGFAALGWWLVRGMLLAIMRSLRSQRSLPSPCLLLPDSTRAWFFRYRRDRWCRAQEQAAGRERARRAH